MAFTFVAAASNPSDSTTYGVLGAGAPTAVAITPPGTGIAGDLVVRLSGVSQSTTTRIISRVEDGGQSWFTIGDFADNSGGVYLLDWCQFNGTWSANPSVIYSNATTAAIVSVMAVFRPTSASSTFTVNAGGALSVYSAPSAPNDVTVTGVTPTEASTVSIAFWLSRDDNTWSLQTGGWSQPQAQWRSFYDTQISASLAYLIQTSAAATGDVVNRQATNGPDSGWAGMVTFAESLPTSIPRALPIPYFVNYRI